LVVVIAAHTAARPKAKNKTKAAARIFIGPRSFPRGAPYGPQYPQEMPFPSGAKVAAAMRCAMATLRSGFSYGHERDSRSQNDQCVYASDHDAKINAGHDPLSLGLGFPIGHRASPSVYLKQKTDIRSEEIFKSIPRYLVPKPLPRSSQ
jgi:hypothetical protein